MSVVKDEVETDVAAAINAGVKTRSATRAEECDSLEWVTAMPDGLKRYVLCERDLCQICYCFREPWKSVRMVFRKLGVKEWILVKFRKDHVDISDVALALLYYWNMRSETDDKVKPCLFDLSSALLEGYPKSGCDFDWLGFKKLVGMMALRVVIRNVSLMARETLV